MWEIQSGMFGYKAYHFQQYNIITYMSKDAGRKDEVSGTITTQI